MFYRADTAAITKRHKAFTGNVFNQFEVRLAPLRCGGNIEEDKLVDFLFVKNLYGIDRVAHVSGVFEFDGLVQATAAQQQERDDAWFQHD